MSHPDSRPSGRGRGAIAAYAVAIASLAVAVTVDATLAAFAVVAMVPFTLPAGARREARSRQVDRTRRPGRAGDPPRYGIL